MNRIEINMCLRAGGATDAQVEAIELLIKEAKNQAFEKVRTTLKNALRSGEDIVLTLHRPDGIDNLIAALKKEIY